MVHALVVFASEAAAESEGSHTAFYVAGAVLALFAVGVSVLGILRPERFAERPGTRSAIIGVALLLVVATTASSVLTA